jgi:hypothetical protein
LSVIRSRTRNHRWWLQPACLPFKTTPYCPCQYAGCFRLKFGGQISVFLVIGDGFQKGNQPDPAPDAPSVRKFVEGGSQANHNLNSGIKLDEIPSHVPAFQLIPTGHLLHQILSQPAPFARLDRLQVAALRVDQQSQWGDDPLLPWLSAGQVPLALRNRPATAPAHLSAVLCHLRRRHAAGTNIARGYHRSAYSRLRVEGTGLLPDVAERFDSEILQR